MECESARAEKRGEMRGSTRQNGTCLKSLIIGDTIRFEEGPVTLLNESENGALFQIPHQLYAGDIIEVRYREPIEQPTTEVFEVRWAQPFEQSSEFHGYVIGCRLIFSTEWIKTFTRPAPTSKPSKAAA